MQEQQTLKNLARKGREALKFLETDTAEQIFRDALELDENFLDGWVGLGQVYYEQGNLKGAVEVFKEALKLAHKQFGKDWREKKLPWRIEKNRPILRLVHGLGLLAYRQGKLKKAREWFELEHRLSPSLEAPLAMLTDIQAGRKYNKLKFRRLDK